jgi:hypothetical protein
MTNWLAYSAAVGIAGVMCAGIIYLTISYPNPQALYQTYALLFAIVGMIANLFGVSYGIYKYRKQNHEVSPEDVIRTK